MRRLFAVSCALLLAGIFCLSQQEHVSAFWQSRDSNYNVAISGGPSPLVWHNATPNTCDFGSTPTQPFACTGLNFGTASADRVIVACFSYQGSVSGTNADLKTVTTQSGAISFASGVDGYTTSTGKWSSIWFANVPTGTTSQSITWTTNSGTGWVDQGTMTIGYLTGSATASVASTVGAGGVSPPAYPSSNSNVGTISVSANRMAAFCGISTNAPGTASTSWSGGTIASTPDVELIDGVGGLLGTLTHAGPTIAAGAITETVANNGAGASGWTAAVFTP